MVISIVSKNMFYESLALSLALKFQDQGLSQIQGQRLGLHYQGQGIQLHGQGQDYGLSCCL